MSSIADGGNDSEGVSSSGGNVKLLDRVRKLLGAGASASLSWEEFVSDFLARDRVERLVVGHDGWARVHLKGASTSKVEAAQGHGSSRGNSGPPRHGEGAMASWLGWTGFRLPSLLSWEFDDVASEVSTASLGSDSTDSSEGEESRRAEGGAGGKDLTAVAVDGKEDDEEANSGARLYLQIGRPSYLERNLKLAYLRLDIPPHRFKSNGMVQNI